MSLVSQLDHQIKQLQQLKAEWERQIAAQYPEFNSCYRQVAELEYRFNQEGEDPTTPFRQS
ncbi:MAG: hypothetical protein EBU46_00210 [Nitrosomonadaceae bacterium]|nr:hypothetical protein [Nitrosomonadaceae bacterium]